MTKTLQSQLNSPWLNTRNKNSYLYVLIDSTKHKDLVDNLLFEEPEHISLFDTSIDIELEKISPYIIKLEEGSKFKKWLLKEWGEKQSGFFFYSNCKALDELYKHFVTFTEIKTTNSNATFIFNFYRPLSLNIWLESMPLTSRLEFFKPIQSIVIESEIKDQVKVMELDTAGFMFTSEVLADNSTKEVQCYQNSMERGANQKTEKNLPWLLSEEENSAIHKISRYNFMLDVTRKIWAYPSIQEKHTYKDLWEKVQNWTESLNSKEITKRKSVALFLVLLAKYEEQWLKCRNEINLILSNKQESSGRVKYLDIRDIVVQAAGENQS